MQKTVASGITRETKRRGDRFDARRAVACRGGRDEFLSGVDFPGAGPEVRIPVGFRQDAALSSEVADRPSVKKRITVRTRGPFGDLPDWECSAAPNMGSSEGGGPLMFEEKHVLRKSCIACGGMYAEVGLPRVWRAGDTHPH